MGQQSKPLTFITCLCVLHTIYYHCWQIITLSHNPLWWLSSTYMRTTLFFQESLKWLSLSILWLCIRTQVLVFFFLYSLSPCIMSCLAINVIPLNFFLFSDMLPFFEEIKEWFKPMNCGLTKISNRLFNFFHGNLY